MTSMKNTFILCIIYLLTSLEISVFAQKPGPSPLFSDDTPLDIRLNISLKDIRKETNDTTYMDGLQLHYTDEAGHWDSIPVKIRTRGHFRLNECFFPPLRIKIKKDDAEGTLFEGNKALKLVLPCHKAGDNNQLVIKEFMCYKIYEKITPYTFSTRLVNIDFWDTRGKNPKNYQLAGFLIEDDDLVAERYGGSIKESLNLHPLALHDTSTIRHDFFQYLIANIDWSTTYMHNTKIILATDPIRYIPLTYDFDMSGFVDAPYATVNPEFDMQNVRDRVYRGFCRSNNNIVYYVRDQYIEQEKSVLETIQKYQPMLDEREYESLLGFVNAFFEIMKSDKLFELEIINKCRTE